MPGSLVGEPALLFSYGAAVGGQAVFLDVLEVLTSLAVLAVAGDQFVLGAGRLATALRVRPAVVGAVIGGLGASVPELVVSTVAAARGDVALADGNLVGSIAANIALALGVAALLAPVRVDTRTIRREAPLSVAAVVLYGALLVGGVSRAEGGVLAGALVVFTVALAGNARLEADRSELALEVDRFFARPLRPVRREAARSLLGLLFMVGGAELLVRSASRLAGRAGLSEGFIGLTVVAVGTTAPLVAIAVQAVRRGNHDLVVGSVLGSNLFIALAGGAIVALVSGGGGLGVDAAALWLMAVLAAASWAFMARGSTVTRWEAGVLILAYAVTIPFLVR